MLFTCLGAARLIVLDAPQDHVGVTIALVEMNSYGSSVERRVVWMMPEGQPLLVNIGFQPAVCHVS